MYHFPFITIGCDTLKCVYADVVVFVFVFYINETKLYPM